MTNEYGIPDEDVAEYLRVWSFLDKPGIPCQECRKVRTCYLRCAIEGQMDIAFDEEGEHDMIFDLVKVMLILSDQVCPRFETT